MSGPVQPRMDMLHEDLQDPRARLYRTIRDNPLVHSESDCLPTACAHPNEHARVMKETSLVGQMPWAAAAAFLMPDFFVIDIVHIFFCNIVPLFWQLILSKLARLDFATCR